MSGEGRVLIGTAGWSYEDWKGVVYPEPMPRDGHALDILSEWFEVVEINASFYRPINPAHCDNWLRRVERNPKFMFTTKLWDRFTHKRDVWPRDRDVQAYIEGITPLHEAGKLGAILIQFPWSFKRTPENRQWLGQIVETFEAYPLSLEIRHATWHTPEFYDGLRANNIAFCNIDQPIFDHSIEPSGETTASFAYVRLHGRNYENWFREDADRNARYDYLYTKEELEPWVKRIRDMKEKVDDVYVTTNNHYQGQAVVNALQMSSMLGEQKVQIPERLLEAYPALSNK